MVKDWIAGPGAPLSGRIRVPGDKSVSHRAIMLASLANGVSRIDGFLEGEDTRATAAVFQQLGVKIEAPSPQSRIVHGVGLRGLRASVHALDCGNAGTGMRLLAGVLAGQAFDSALIGDASLSKRPMRRVIDPLAKMGAQIDSEDGGLPPLRIRGGRTLQGIDYTLPVASAQVSRRCCSPVCTPKARRWCASRIPPAITPSACCPRSAGPSNSNPASRACAAARAMRMRCARPTCTCRRISRPRPSSSSPPA